MNYKTKKTMVLYHEAINTLYEELNKINHKRLNNVENEVLELLIDRINDCRILSRTLAITKLKRRTKSYAGKVRLL